MLGRLVNISYLYTVAEPLPLATKLITHNSKLITLFMFDVRLYPKAELALLYCPHASQDSALKTLYRWINGCPMLRRELNEMRYNPRRHTFLKHEVEAIVKHLGEP